MKTWIVSGLIQSEDHSWLRESRVFQRVAETFGVQLAEIDLARSLAAQMLAAPLSDPALSKGVLRVAAFGFDPPEKSTHFCMDLLSFSGDALSLAPAPSAEEWRELLPIFDQLKSKSLIPLVNTLQSPSVKHALVWERFGDTFCWQPPKTGETLSFAQCLPVGDGEQVFRRLIDDSVNLLWEQDFNRRRIDLGLPPLNVLWPSSNGFRLPVTNLVVQYRIPKSIHTIDLSLFGLARLSGYRPQYSTSDTALHPEISSLTTYFLNPIVVNHETDWEEWLDRCDRWSREVLETQLDRLSSSDHFQLIALPDLNANSVLSGNMALGLAARFGEPGGQNLPFDERTLNEARAPRQTLADLCRD